MAKQRKRRPSIRMVAEHVELSPTTVSLALRGDESIPLSTRNRIIDAARELNYDFESRNRRAVRSDIRNIAYVVRDFDDDTMASNPFYGPLLAGVQQESQDQNLNLNFAFMQHDHPDNVPLPSPIAGDVDGIIISSPFSPRVVDRVAREKDCPVVLADNLYPGCPYDSIMADDHDGGYRTTQHLIELGHRNIQPIVGTMRNIRIPPSLMLRYEGYYAACRDHNITPRPAVYVPNHIEEPHHNNFEPYHVWLSDILPGIPDVTAFFGASDLFALGAILSLQQNGYRVPEDYSVVGFDDYEMSSIVKPSLTTISSYKRSLGRAAITRLMARMDGDIMPRMTINIGVELVIRNSTGPPRKD